MKKEIKANVQFDLDGCIVELDWYFELYNPVSNHCRGIGCFMKARNKRNDYIINETYAGTTDILELAERFLISTYGEDLKGVIYENP